MRLGENDNSVADRLIGGSNRRSYFISSPKSAPISACNVVGTVVIPLADLDCSVLDCSVRAVHHVRCLRYLDHVFTD